MAEAVAGSIPGKVNAMEDIRGCRQYQNLHFLVWFGVLGKLPLMEATRTRQKRRPFPVQPAVLG
ncbi:hypothetical protein PoMZ_07067 [Pyricularia oryzae]|uniref:Uncharacterized protein n=1 Tax=Pyricularia oryzae TaxID=318829 RepID=A0A4P7NE69_PYROR|nr:hypothetical protein PoMZ_07067 [Pyricularia oryzae]